MTINLSKVEEVTFESQSKGECRLFYIKFKAIPGVKFSQAIESEGNMKTDKKSESVLIHEVRIPANNAYGREYFISPETEKVFKAFNHLRKLCGAPDPIKFD